MIGCTLPASALVRVISQLCIQSARRVLPLFTCVALLCCFSPELHAAAPDRVAPDANMARMQTLPNQHPLWASQANGIAPVPAGDSVNSLTLVLARSRQQQAAFEQFLADQQNPASPEYHHWLTPAEVGERFGVSDADVATVTAWLQSQGLVVNWIAPSRLFIGFGGTAASINSAFHTELRTYRVNGVARMSVSSDPQIPQALAPVIKAIRGLYSIDEQPQHIAAPAQLAAPEITFNSSHFIGPGDFNIIYDVPRRPITVPASPSASWERPAPMPPTSTTSRRGRAALSATLPRLSPQPSAASIPARPSPRPPSRLIKLRPKRRSM